MSAGLVAGSLVLALACLACGAVLLHARVAVVSAAALVAAGGSGALAVRLIAGGHAAPGRALGVLAVLVLGPFALWAYPRPPASVAGRVVALLVIAPGVFAVFRAGSANSVAGAGLFTTLAVVGWVWWRLEREPATRGPVLWGSLGVVVPGLLGLLVLFLNDGRETWIAAAGAATALMAAAPMALVVGVLRPESVDVRGLVVRAAVGGVVASGYVAVFVGADAAAVLAGVRMTAPAYAVLGLACALAVRPSAVVLGRVLDRLLFGDRPDPIAAATRVAGGLGDDPAQALDVVRDALAVPWVALLAPDGTPLAASGSAVPSRYVVPLPAGGPDGAGRTDGSTDGGTDGSTDGSTDGGTPSADLVVGLRPGDLTMPAADRRVLDLVAPLLAQILRARALTAAVQASRGQVVAAVEDERRRLRRDLHDELGPTLTGVAFTVDAARNTLARDPDAAAGLLDAIRADTVDAIAHVRRIVYGMRPPALDELGLLGALRQQARGLRRADGALVAVRLVADGGLDGLPAAVEVAAYRIVVEAMTNVARHAAATVVDVTLSVAEHGSDCDATGPALVVEVVDDGGTGPDWVSGVGLASMRERAAEVRGSFEGGQTAAGGRVLASLPLR
ncbi:sensor histidine kinase [Kineosporia sp. A_224]|uniref:sensor histidine kinase n=1 Tax=Kineosporia sp. A_224 TaxID=1962180 RepID=UPI000B4B5BE5|nr:histidine kinase [Kineosporia sp. A_224]